MVDFGENGISGKRVITVMPDNTSSVPIGPASTEPPAAPMPLVRGGGDASVLGEALVLGAKGVVGYHVLKIGAEIVNDLYDHLFGRR